jgi:UDP-glucose 4-epimerase
MHILVTGGAGFIGSHVVAAYLAEGHRVSIVDDLSTGRRSNINPDAVFYEVDIRDRDALARVFATEKPEVVNHHGAQSAVLGGIHNPTNDASVNVQGMINVLELSRDNGTRKVIHISSACVFGNPRYNPVDEEHPKDPRTMYGTTKFVGEGYVKSFYEMYGLSYSILRYANAYGPRQNPFGEAGVITLFVTQLLRGATPKITWNGEQAKDYIYASDAARANVLLLSGGDQEDFNFGTGQAVTVNQIYRNLCEHLGIDRDPIYIDRRPGDFPLYAYNSDKFFQHFGYRAQVDFREGSRQMIAYYHDHPEELARS